MKSTFPLKIWRNVFETFQQVESTHGIFDRDVVSIRIQGRSEPLEATLNELNDTLCRFNGNPKEVASHFLKSHGYIAYYQNTLVGFFDIIGYSSFLEKTDFVSCVRRLESFMSNAVASGTDCMGLKLDHWILSDSIIIVIDTNRSTLNLQSLKIFFGTCADIMTTAMAYNFPLRGAVGGGDFYKDAAFMVSSALVDAAKYEKQQDWLGAVITPKALDLVEIAKKQAPPDMTIDLSSSFRSIKFGPIPWKNGVDIEKPEESYYIKPSMIVSDWEKHLPKHFEGDLKRINSRILYT